MNLLTNIHMLQEAYAGVNGITIERKFSDRELGPELVEIEEAEGMIEQQQITAAQETK